MAFWLIKTEPHSWSWADQKYHKTTAWDGVRNYQARNFMKEMKRGDLCFFYHSVVEKQIVGIVSVVKEYYPDPKAETFGIVDVTLKEELYRPVTLNKIKNHPDLQTLPLVTQSRLSVMPIDGKAWKIIVGLSQK